MIPAIYNSRQREFPVYDDGKGKLGLKVALGLMTVAVIGLFFLLFGIEALPFRVERPYLIPWVIATGIVIVAPILYLKKKGEFSFVNPVVFLAGTYFFPIFFLGGWSLVFGLSNYYYLAFVNNPEYDFPLTFFYIMLGFGAFSIGMLIPAGRTLGKKISLRLPEFKFKPLELTGVCILFLVGGFYAMLLALNMGQIGYRNGESMIIGDAGSLQSYMTVVVPTSVFLLWVVFFKLEEWNVFRYIILATQLVTALFLLIILGTKSSPFVSIIYFGGAFVLVGRKITLWTGSWLAVGLLVALVAGFMYGVTFRSMKDSSDRLSTGEYAGIAVDTIKAIGEGDGLEQTQEAFLQIANRLEIASSLAVVVSNYEAMASYEAAYGLEGNIWQYTWTAFIPRFLWKDKPIIADIDSYNDLYFGYRGFGLSITAMGDLVRNFGPLGIPIGMFVLGFFLRMFYASLIEGQPFSAWRSVLYFMVLIRVNCESFYGEIFPTAIRIATIVIIQLLLMRILIKLFTFRRS